jgi:hypothetical protein
MVIPTLHGYFVLACFSFNEGRIRSGQGAKILNPVNSTSELPRFPDRLILSRCLLCRPRGY